MGNTELVKALSLNLTDKDKNLLDLILTEDDKILDRGVNILKESAELVGRTSDITLMRHQVIPILMMQVTNRVLNGFSPGIGKTYSSCGAYALYRMKCIKNGIEPKKLLLVTLSSHVKGMESDFRRGGVKLLSLTGGGNAKVKRRLTQAQEESKTGEIEDEYDGIVTNWDTLKTNEFIKYYTENKDKYDFGIFDETTEIMNKNTTIYKVSDAIINKYQGGLNYVMFLNGTNFSTGIYDIYNQLNMLKPRLIPNKRWIDDRYVVKATKEVWGTKLVNNKGKAGSRRDFNRITEIVSYKNQEEFRDKLRYYIITKNKSDISDALPKITYDLHMIGLSPKLRKVINEGGSGVIHKLNSPMTSDPKAKMTRAQYPKLDYLLDRVKETIEDRPVIYCLNKSVMYTIKESVEKMGYRVGILNGEVSSEEKSIIQERFNNYEYDVLVLNVEKAINLPTSDRLIFYTIPSLPLKTNQIKARIDRNNYDTPKFYDFLCYEDSEEVGYIARLGHFREGHGKLLTGQGDDNVYEQLVDQMKLYYSDKQMEDIKNLADKVDGLKVKWEDVEKDINEVLGI